MGTPVGAVVIALASLFAAGSARAADVRLNRIGSFDQPVYVTGVPGAARKLVVVERYGRIRVVVPGRRSKLLADLRSRVRIDNPRETVDQRGLFSVALPPDYRRSGRFYAAYVDRTGRSMSSATGPRRSSHSALDVPVEAVSASRACQRLCSSGMTCSP